MTDNERDQELVRLFKEGKNRKEIAEETGREYSSLCRHMRKLGLGVYANTEQKEDARDAENLFPTIVTSSVRIAARTFRRKKTKR